MTGIGWLHLSDLRVRFHGSLWQRPRFREALERDLRSLHERSGPWDLLLVSGDLASSGSETEYGMVVPGLASLMDFIISLGSSPTLLAVPGNHDLVRTSPEAVPSNAQWHADEALREAFWDNADHPFRQAVQLAFGPFTGWQGFWADEHPTRDQGIVIRRGLLPGDFSARIIKDGGRFGIVGMNTAFLEVSEHSAYGLLDLDRRQTEPATGGTGEWADGNSASILLTHHDPDALHPRARAELEDVIAPPGRFVLHLCGGRRRSRSPVRARHALVFAAHPFSGAIDPGAERGYAAGRLELRGAEARVRIWPRSLSFADREPVFIAEPGAEFGHEEAIERSIFRSTATRTTRAFVAPRNLEGIALADTIEAESAAARMANDEPPSSEDPSEIHSRTTITTPMRAPVPDVPSSSRSATIPVPSSAPMRAPAPASAPAPPMSTVPPTRASRRREERIPGVHRERLLHTDMAINRLVFSPAGDALALGLANGHLLVHEVRTGALRFTAEAHGSAVLDVCYAPSGERIATRARDEVRLWDARSGALVWTFDLRDGGGERLAWSARGILAAGAANGTILLFDATTFAQIGSIDHGLPPEGLHRLAFSPDGALLASTGPEDGLIVLSEIHDGKARMARAAEVHALAALDIAFHPGSRLVASASRDRTVVVWDAVTGARVAQIEGHTHVVVGVAFSADGRLLASKSYDSTIALHRTDTWERVARILEPMPLLGRAGIAFAPGGRSMLATTGAGDRGVRLWSIDVDALLRAPPNAATVHSTTAKVVLVGEGRAGKSCLALRLAEDRYEELAATHGMRFWPIPAELLDPAASAPTNERREVVLWDLGGQEEYRLIHQLFLRDTTVALLVLEPGRGQPALDEIEVWNERLAARAGATAPLRKILVGTKVDDEHAPVDAGALERLGSRIGSNAYVQTSAKQARGVEELRAAIASAIDWSALGTTTRTSLFQRIREHVQDARTNHRVVLTLPELEAEIRDREAEAFDPAAVSTVVTQLARQGLVADTHLSDGTRALVLDVEAVERYAGSLILLARDNPHGVPALDTAAVLAPSARFPRIRPEERLRRDQELVTLDCVIELLLEHGICFRHEGLLVFPSLFPASDAEPSGPAEHAVSLYYELSGPVDNIYASVVAALAMSRHFGPVRLYGGRADFGRPGEGFSELRKVVGPPVRGRGIAQLEIRFDPVTPEGTRQLFVSFIEDHLRETGVRFLEKLGVTCTCGHVFAEDVVRQRLFAGQSDIGCPACDARTALLAGAAEAKAKNPDLARQIWGMRNDIRERLAESVAETKIGRPTRTSLTPEPIRILHLSDLHISESDDPDSLLQPLVTDLRDRVEGLALERLDALVVSGDLTNCASPAELERARQFISALVREFGLTAEKCVIVPGNHDLDWDTEVYASKKRRKVDVSSLAAGTYREQGDIVLVRDEARYGERFRNFSQHLHHPLFQREYPLAPEAQCAPVLLPEARVQFFAMSSAWEIDEYFPGRASIHEGALSRGLHEAQRQLERARESGALAPGADVLRIAVFHHPVTGNEKIQDDAFLDRLRQADVRVCLHGHVHEDRPDVVNYLHPVRRLHVVGAGSFGAPAHHRPESVPRLYNMVEIDRDLRKMRVHTRQKRRAGGAWEGWAAWPGTSAGERRTFYDVPFR
ncbi:metallophosphoesterase [Polyangium aurulentum]|uniref:metallophosphoesterase n=1 Tax=Polyangium aurulentum TaxID=2567896 RepID=UPI0010ADEA23|nr:metallophosphoesterase [Polyangium aurulentum]UQA57567.1 metallophosphoesterase [Polyangium aurulentum]